MALRDKQEKMFHQFFFELLPLESLSYSFIFFLSETFIANGSFERNVVVGRVKKTGETWKKMEWAVKKGETKLMAREG